jgi:hypothetical protein
MLCEPPAHGCAVLLILKLLIDAAEPLHLEWGGFAEIVGHEP